MPRNNIPMASINASTAIKQVVLCIMVLLFLVVSSEASADIRNWDDLLQVGGNCSGLPKDLILSVIWNESRGNPNAVNINGVASYSPSSPAEALRHVYRHKRANVDIGLMQVNWLTWGPIYGLTISDLLNPATNVCVGSRILRNYINEHKGSWRGVGRYNAVSYNKQEAYAYRISRTMRQIREMLQRTEK